MHNLSHRKPFFAALAFILLSVAALWSLNVVSALFGGPELQYKHAIAIFALLAISRLAVNPGRQSRVRHRERQDS